MHIRMASPVDCAAILAIYAQYIDTAVTFEYALPDEAAFAARMAGILGEYPYLVCEAQGRVVGYAYAHRAMARAAYQWGAELSIYLDRRFTARGIGRALYLALMEVLRLQGVKTVYGCVTLPNERSERLHERLGFRRSGVWQNAGYKCGRWWDVGWFEKPLAAYEGEPSPIRAVSQIPAALQRAIEAAALPIEIL